MRMKGTKGQGTAYSELQDAVLEVLAFMVLSEGRPASYMDFVPCFEAQGKVYHIAHGTFHNIMAKMMKNGDIIPCYTSQMTFYSLPGHPFSRNAVTHYPRGVSRDLLDRVRRLAFQERAIHDIHLTFTSHSLWGLVAATGRYTQRAVSKDIAIDEYRIGLAVVKVTLHHSDSVSVVISCSDNPIPLDAQGVLQFSEILIRTEERVSQVIRACCEALSIKNPPAIQGYRDWVITMWHFGRDSLTECTGKMYNVTWQVGMNTFHAYAKKFAGAKVRHRVEIEETPRQPVQDVLADVLERPDLCAKPNYRPGSS